MSLPHHGMSTRRTLPLVLTLVLVRATREEQAGRAEVRIDPRA